MLRDSAVRSELALTVDQIDRLQKISADANYFGQLGPVVQKLRSAETDEERLAAREEFLAVSQKLSLELEAKAKPVLDEKQFGRAMQIHLQRQGVRALMRSDVARDLEITMMQADQLKATYLEYEATRLPQDFLGGDTEAQKRRREFEAKMVGVLTDEQKANWTEKLGAPAPGDPAAALRGSVANLRSSPAAQSAARRGSGSQATAGETPLPSSFGMIDADSIVGRINFVVVAEVLAARGRTLSLNRDQLQLLTNLETRIGFDKRLGNLRLRLSHATTFEECVAIRSESGILLEEWNAEVEQDVRMIVGEQGFTKLRPAILKRQGLWALTRPDVAVELKVTANQSDQLRTILNDYRAAAAEASVDATRQEHSRLAAQFEQRMMQVLTAGQRTQWQSVTRLAEPAL